MPKRVFVRISGPWRKTADKMEIRGHHAKRITRMITSAEAVKNIAGNSYKKRRVITKGKFQTLPGKIVVLRKVIPGSRGDPDRKTKQYFAAFDANETNVVSLPSGKQVIIHSGHDILHLRHEVFSHEHGLKRNEFGVLSHVEDRLFLSFNMPFGYRPNELAKLPKNYAYTNMLQLKKIRNPRVFTELLNTCIDSMVNELTLQFPSKRAYMRAIIELNRDAKMRTVLRKLNSVPATVSYETDLLTNINPRYWHRLQGILIIYEFMKQKAIEYRRKTKQPNPH